MWRLVSLLLLISGLAYTGEDIAWSDSFTLSDNTSITLDDMSGRQVPTLNISQNTINNKIRIFINYRTLTFKSEILIYNIQGKLVKKLKADSRQLYSGIAWDTSHYPSGIYFIHLKMDAQTISNRFALVK